MKRRTSHEPNLMTICGLVGQLFFKVKQSFARCIIHGNRCKVADCEKLMGYVNTLTAMIHAL